MGNPLDLPWTYDDESPVPPSALEEAINDPRILRVALTVVMDMAYEPQGQEALENYIETCGDTDWVYLEETASMHVSAQFPNNRLAYLAVMELVFCELEGRFHVDPPTWFLREGRGMTP